MSVIDAHGFLLLTTKYTKPTKSFVFFAYFVVCFIGYGVGVPDGSGPFGF